MVVVELIRGIGPIVAMLLIILAVVAMLPALLYLFKKAKEIPEEMKEARGAHQMIRIAVLITPFGVVFGILGLAYAYIQMGKITDAPTDVKALLKRSLMIGAIPVALLSLAILIVVLIIIVPG